MANYTTLKESVNAYIKANGVRAITGPVLNGILTQMINTLGDGARYGGIATPSGNPGTHDNVVFFLATTAGTYTNYGGAVLDGSTLHILYYDSTWHDLDTGVPTSTAFATKADKDEDAVEGNIAKFDANGNPVDAGIAAEKINQLGQEISNIIYRFTKTNVAAYQSVDFPTTIKAGARIINNGVHVILASDSSLSNRIDIPHGRYVDLPTDVSFIQTSADAGDVDIQVLNGEIAKIEDDLQQGVVKKYVNVFDKYATDTAFGYYLSQYGTLTANSSYNTSGFLSVKPNTTYYVGGNQMYPCRYVNFYNAGKTHIASSQQQNKYVFTTPANCYYIKVSLTTTIWENHELQITETARSYSFPYNPISAYLTDDKLTDGKVILKRLGKNKFNYKTASVEKYLKADGTLQNGSDYFATDFIPFDHGKMIASINGKAVLSGGGYICYYDDSGTLLSSHTATSTFGIATWYEGVSFVRFSVSTTNPSTNIQKAQVEYGEIPSAYEPYGFYIDNTDLAPGTTIKSASSQRGSATLAAGESFTLPLVYCRYAQTLTAIINGTIGTDENVEIGRSLNYGQYNGGSLKITPTNIIFAGTSYPHGLTLTNRTFVTLITDNKCLGKVILMTSAGSKYEISDLNTALWGGEAFAKNNTNASVSVELSLELRKLNSTSWIFGDSYCSYSTLRWPYYVIDWGLDNFLMDNLSGGDSAQLYSSLMNLIDIGCPKYIVWCLGMNGGADSADAPNAAWLTYVKSVIAQCDGRNITPILATIPSVPSQAHEKLNEWVRNSGYRYIDFAKAVNAQPDGTWDSGLLSADNVHPTESGAKVLASRVLLDFPEISLINP